MYKVSVSLEEAQIQSPFVSGGGTYYKTFILFLIKTHELKFFFLVITVIKMRSLEVTGVFRFGIYVLTVEKCILSCQFTLPLSKYVGTVMVFQTH